MEELKPCPFCGSEAEYYSECEMIKVRCSNYDCWCALVTWFDEPEEATEEWNKRAVDIVRCEECKYFEADYIRDVEGIPLIITDSVCSFWGRGCKTKSDGYCSFGVRRTA